MIEGRGSHDAEVVTRDIGILTSLNITTEHGTADCYYNPESRRFLINGFWVDEDCRGQGFGKELLRIAKNQAQSMGATAIIAAIVSQESLVAMTSVFGTDHIEMRRGLYGKIETPVLNYPLHGNDSLQNESLDSN